MGSVHYECQSGRLPKIDFSGLEPGRPGVQQQRWSTVREQVMEALEAFSSFQVVYEGVTPEQWAAFFGKAIHEVFDLPLDAKLRNKTKEANYGYIGQIPGMDYESLVIDNAINADGVEAFTALMWPQGGPNPIFCETVTAFAKRVSEVDEMVRRMVAESLGIEEEHMMEPNNITYSLRVSEYGAPRSKEDEGMVSLPVHTDMPITGIVCQHQVGGLQVQARDGNWFTTSENSMTCLVGDTFSAWTNGRLEACPHRVVQSGSTETRYSAILHAHPKIDGLVEAPPELVDEKHPLQFKPFVYRNYVNFCFSDAAKGAKSALKAYCGTDLIIEQISKSN